MKQEQHTRVRGEIRVLISAMQGNGMARPDIREHDGCHDGTKGSKSSIFALCRNRAPRVCSVAM
jgi:hypothetical protein